jgi:hypothetical protein
VPRKGQRLSPEVRAKITEANRKTWATKTPDLTNKKIGEWKILGKSPRRSNGEILWFCACSCGTVKEVTGVALRSGNSNSCGHLNRARLGDLNRKPPGVSACHKLFLSYKNGAKRRKLNWQLTEGEFALFTKLLCFYCGISPSTVYANPGGGDYVYNGIDRLDSDQGYLSSNCVSCCKTCNYAKNNMKPADFFRWIERVYSYASRTNWSLEV